MSTSEELARLHIETAIKLVGRETVLAMIGPAPTAAATGGAGARGRRPGAAPDDARCQWKMADDSQCKNAKAAEKDYCRIHATKVDLIDL